MQYGRGSVGEVVVPADHEAHDLRSQCGGRGHGGQGSQQPIRAGSEDQGRGGQL